MKLSPQHQRILAALRNLPVGSNGWVSAWYLAVDCRCLNYRKRISEMNASGYVIENRVRHQPALNTKHSEYFLVSEPQTGPEKISENKG